MKIFDTIFKCKVNILLDLINLFHEVTFVDTYKTSYIKIP